MKNPNAAIRLASNTPVTSAAAVVANNATNALNSYINHVAEALGENTALCFSQPLLNDQEQRINFYALPTNLGVDGSDIFSVAGLAYYKRYGVKESFVTRQYLCDRMVPWNLQDMYDKVLYPLNIVSAAPVSQLDAALWLMNQQTQHNPSGRTIIFFWTGNNDSSNAALGYGARRPAYVPLPFDMLFREVSDSLALILAYGVYHNLISFEPYRRESIERVLTEDEDFHNQYRACIERLVREAQFQNRTIDLFLCTLPYYSSVGYLFDSEDLEFYLRKVNARYTVPPSFKRVTEPGAEIDDYTRGDRISLITFLCMYVLLSQGYDVSYVNQVIDTSGIQRDGLVLSEQEQADIRERIDRFNERIEATAAQYGAQVHVVHIGEYLNDVLTGKIKLSVNGIPFTRRWGRGNSFTLDGVHPGYTAHALIANFFISTLNEELSLGVSPRDLEALILRDPYIDHDGDGWVPGPSYSVSGIPELLFLFRDPDDSDPDVQPVMPDDIWQRISEALVQLLI